MDVRTVEEFAAGHAPGAINIPLLTRGAGGMQPNPLFLDQVKERLEGDDSKEIIVGCKSGGRSMNAAQQMSNSPIIVSVPFIVFLACFYGKEILCTCKQNLS